MDVLVITPFRRPTFRGAISSWYPGEEPWDSPAFSVAGELEAAGIEVGVLTLQTIFPAFNESADLQDLAALLKSTPAKVVLFVSDPLVASRSTATTYGMRVVSEVLHSLDREPLIGVCGRLATTTWRTLFERFSFIDFVVLGEAEAVIADIVSDVLTLENPGLSSHPNIMTRARLQRGPGAVEYARIADPETCALPAYHLAQLSLEQHEARRPPSATVPFSLRTSYGCRFRCRFCAGVPHWQDYRRKSPARVDAELSALESRTGGRARLAFLEDEIFTIDSEHVRAISGVLTDHHVFLDGLYTHASVLTPTIAKDLRPITQKVFLGLDSAEDRVLRHMRKGQLLETVLDAVQTAAAAGLGVHLEWIIGSPAETTDSLATSLTAIFNLLHTGVVESINTYVYCPHPGTEYAEHADAYGIDVVEDLEYIQESGGYPAAEIPGLTRNQVFTAYLLSQLVIQETLAARTTGGPVADIAPGNHERLRRILEQVGSVDSPSLAR